MSAPATRDDDRIDVTVPLDARYASMLRIIAAAVGADAGFSVDEIEDVRLGLNEAFSLLAERPDGGRVLASFRVDGDRLVVELVPDTGAADVRPDELADAILRAVLDRCTFAPDRITLEKVATEASHAA